MGERLWTVQRVRAGPLVKELRMIRPRASESDTAEDRKDKEFIRAHCAVLRDPSDRLELRLAMIGIDGLHYVLTFDPDHLPERYADVLDAWQAFLRRCKRQRITEGKPGAFPFVKRIEGLHARYHIHFVCSPGDFSPEQVRELWQYGFTSWDNVILDHTGFRRLARYFLKERRDGERLPLDKQPLSWSASLKLPSVEVSKAAGGEIALPPGAVSVHQPAMYYNRFGGFSYASWILPDHNRAGARARDYLKWGAYRRTRPKKEAQTD